MKIQNIKLISNSNLELKVDAMKDSSYKSDNIFLVCLYGKKSTHYKAQLLNKPIEVLWIRCIELAFWSFKDIIEPLINREMGVGRSTEDKRSGVRIWGVVVYQRSKILLINYIHVDTIDEIK